MALKLFQLVFLSCLGSSALGLAHPLGHGKVSGHPTTLHQRLDAPRSPSASGGKAAVWIANKSPRSDVGQVLAAAASSSAEEGEGNKALDLKGGAAPTGNRGIGGKALPIVLLVILVLHKSVTDGLSRYTRVSGAAYSATTVSIIGEVIKVPILAIAIMIFEGKDRLMPIVKEALTESPFSMCLPGAMWAGQNVLYFLALSHVSAASYQILSQSKLIFTAIFMGLFLGLRLTFKQTTALFLLLTGSVCTQLSEISRSSLVGGGNAAYGGFLTVLGAALSALPNVYYEKILKKSGQNQWTKNIQVTFWIWFWLLVIAIPDIIKTPAASMTAANLFAGITPLVWFVCFLQGFKCLLIPATLKYADNILYAYAKPASVFITAVATALISGILPSMSFLGGFSLVFLSMYLYGA